MSKRTRWIALFVLTGINLLNYIDRYIFSALLPAIKSDLHFSDTELGVLGSAFLFAYVFASPIFGHFGDRTARSRLMSIGVGVWSISTAFSGICTSFLGQFVTRATVGLGESAYSVIAPSCIADAFSKVARGRVFAIYSGAIPVGSALGYVIGGWLEPRVGWQKAFFVVGVPGMLLAALLFFLPDPKRGAADQEDAAHEGASVAPEKALPVREVYAALMKNGGFLCTVLGYAAYTFVVGGMAFWMPSYLVRYFHVSLEAANVQFGTLTVAGGFVGTVLGGYWSDWLEKRNGNGFLKVSVLSMLFSVPLFVYSLSLGDYKAFMTALFVLEVALFLCISPLDAAVISYVRPAWRSSAMALNVFLIHVLGDGISRTLMGVVSDASDLRASIEILPWALAVAGLFWLVGYLFFWQPAHWPEGAVRVPRLQAHRGSCPEESGVVENTLPAFRRARELGAEMSECDIQVTSDGEAVVFHDENLKRLGGRDERVATVTAAQMAEWVKAPTLKALLTDPAATPLINIEIKSGLGWSADGRLERAAVRAILDAGAEGRVIFSSFNPFALRRAAKLAPKIPRALLVSEEKDPRNLYYLRRGLLGGYARAHAVNAEDSMIHARSMEAFRNRGLRVYAWTVNDPRRARELFDLGVSGVISDVILTENDLKARS